MRHLKLVIASSLLGTTLLAAPAFADIPPEDSCEAADAGKACDNAGDTADQPGTCQKDMCTRATPNGPMTYACYVCKPETPGAGGNGAGGNEPTSQAGAAAEGGAEASGGGNTDAGTTSTAGSTSTGGISATGGTKSAGGNSSSAGAKSDSSSKDDGGCALVSAPVGGLAGLLGPLAAWGLAVARRRRAQRG